MHLWLSTFEGILGPLLAQLLLVHLAASVAAVLGFLTNGPPFSDTKLRRIRAQAILLTKHL